MSHTLNKSNVDLEIQHYCEVLQELADDPNYRYFSRLMEYAKEPEITVNRLTNEIQMYSGFLAIETQTNDFLLRDFDNLEKILYKLQFEDQQNRFLKNARLAISERNELQRKKKQRPCEMVENYRKEQCKVKQILDEGKERITLHRHDEEERLLEYQNYIKETTVVKAQTDENGEVIEPEKQIVTWLKAQDKNYQTETEALRQFVEETLANLQNMEKMREKAEFIRLPNQVFD